MAEEKHVHKYLRVRLGPNGYTVYKCVLPGCSHYIRRELVEGNMTLCWRCGKEVPMNKKMATLKKPHCFGCTRQSSSAA